MNKQNNFFQNNHNSKSFEKKNEKTINEVDSKEKHHNEEKAPKVNLNPMNSEKMNNNPTNQKIKDMNAVNIPISGSDNTDNNPINPGMIKAEAHLQHNMIKPDEKEKQPAFSKAMIGNMKNPAESFIREENGTQEQIQPLDHNSEYHDSDDVKTSKKNIRKIIMIIIVVGILIEAGVLIIGTIIKNTKVTTVICSNSNDYDYYKATIKSDRKYFLKQNKIIKLEEEINYVFSNSNEYLKYKEQQMNHPYDNIKGRSTMTSVNDDTLTYTEKIIYDYDVLLKNHKNISKEKNKITIATKNKNDTIDLINSDAEGIQTYYKDTYTCK